MLEHLKHYPKRGDHVSYWLQMRVSMAREAGDSIEAEVTEALLDDYCSYADESRTLPLTKEEVL